MQKSFSKLFFLTLLICTSISFSFFPIFAASGINRAISFQGKLVNPTTKVNVTNATYEMVFSIYDDLTGGNLKWSETHSAVLVSDGVFKVEIGSISAMQQDLFNEDNRYLEIKVSGETLNSRIRFTASPYAMNAGNAEKVDHLTLGSHDITFTTSGATSLTLPTSGALATLAGTEVFTNKTLGSGTKISLGSDATGDMYYRDNSGMLTRLPAGVNGKVLVASEGVPTWTSAIGLDAMASGSESIAIGTNTKALGSYSTTMGLGTKAKSYVSTALGQCNSDTGTTTSWNTTDPLFMIGNGDYNGTACNSNTNALVLFKNGNMTIAGTLTQNSDIRFKKDIVALTSSLSKIKELRGVSFNWKTDDFPNRFDTAPQIGFIAQEVESILPDLVKIDSEGYQSLAYDRFVPYIVEAIKEQQTIIEKNTTSVNKIMGSNTTALGDNSFASGYFTKAGSYASVAFGRCNIDSSANPTSWIDADSLFMIGNGSHDGTNCTSNVNALTVLKNGETKISTLSTNGTVYSNGTSLTNVSPSDINLKKNIFTLDDNLSKILKLRSVSFDWKNNNKSARGFIAQEVQNVIPELVGTNSDGKLGLYADQFTPYIVGAIQEQQVMIDKNITDISTNKNNIDLNIASIISNTASITNNTTNINKTLSDINAFKNPVLDEIANLKNKDQSFDTKIASITAQLNELVIKTSQPNVIASDSATSNLVQYLASSTADLTTKTSNTQMQLNSAISRIAILEQALSSGGSISTPSSSILLGQIATHEALFVTGNTNINNLSVTGNITAGLLAINSTDGSIQTVGTSLKLQPQGLDKIEMMGGKVEVLTNGDILIKNGKLEVQNGNLEIKQGVVKGNGTNRGKVTLPANTNSIRVNVAWSELPESISTTSTYKTMIWVDNIDNTGFTINIETTQGSDKTIYWNAVW